MGEILLERVEELPLVIYSITICRRNKSDSQIRRENDLDNTFNTDVASDIIYHRVNGTTISGLRGWLREEYFEGDVGETKIGDDSIILRLPSHRFYFSVSTGDWIECEGLSYNVILSKRSMGGTTTLLLHQR